MSSKEEAQKTQIISGLAQELNIDAQTQLSGTGPRFVIFQGGDKNSQYKFSASKTTIGRHPSSDIYLDDVTVSRQHAEVSKSDDSVSIQDIGSLNGTYVNKERIESKNLTSGDEVQIGKFKFLYLDIDIEE